MAENVHQLWSWTFEEVVEDFLAGASDSTAKAHRLAALVSYPVLSMDPYEVAEGIDAGRPVPDVVQEGYGVRRETAALLSDSELLRAVEDHYAWDYGLRGLLEWINRVPVEWLPSTFEGWQVFFRAQRHIYWISRDTSVPEVELVARSRGNWSEIVRTGWIPASRKRACEDS
jgi:hypothetical protein